MRAACHLVLLAWVAGASGGEQRGPGTSPGVSTAAVAIHAHDIHSDEGSAGQRRLLLTAAERALSSGDVGAATATLETAAGLAHAADTELLQIRTLMQGGAYRQAANFAAHTAGIHLDETLAPALYAWLLELGGQGDYARRMLDEVAARAPVDPITTEVRALLADPNRPFPLRLFEPPHRFAPYATLNGAVPPPADAVLRANGALWRNGRIVIAPTAALAGARKIWVRNGLGQTARVAHTREVAGSAISLLTLTTPLPPGSAQWAVCDAFAGSPGFAMMYPGAERGAPPMWPRLVPGFLGGATATSDARRLGIALPAGPRGGPVFDRVGDVTGVAIANDTGDWLLPVTSLRTALGEPVQETVDCTSRGGVLPIDEGYERALYTALQVIGAP